MLSVTEFNGARMRRDRLMATKAANASAVSVVINNQTHSGPMGTMADSGNCSGQYVCQT